MLASIHPLGERARHHRWGVTATWYLAGSTAGGAVLGGTLGGLAGWRAPLLAVGLLCLGAAGWDASGRRPPGLKRQVDERWLDRYRGWVYGAGFGFQLGMGVVTIVTTASVWLTFALATVSGGLVAGAVIGGAFGLARAVPVLALGRALGPAPLRRAHRAMAGAATWAARLTVAGLALAGLAGAAAGTR